MVTDHLLPVFWEHLEDYGIFLMGAKIGQFITQGIVFQLQIKEGSQIEVSIARQLDLVVPPTRSGIIGVVKLVVLAKSLVDFFLSDTRLLLPIE